MQLAHQAFAQSMTFVMGDKFSPRQNFQVKSMGELFCGARLT
jgi:hypothetical protein